MLLLIGLEWYIVFLKLLVVFLELEVIEWELFFILVVCISKFWLDSSELYWVLIDFLVIIVFMYVWFDDVIFVCSFESKR